MTHQTIRTFLDRRLRTKCPAAGASSVVSLAASSSSRRASTWCIPTVWCSSGCTRGTYSSCSDTPVPRVSAQRRCRLRCLGVPRWSPAARRGSRQGGPRRSPTQTPRPPPLQSANECEYYKLTNDWSSLLITSWLRSAPPSLPASLSLSPALSPCDWELPAAL